MNRFTPYLQKIHEQLDLPQPVKSRILLEIAADMEDYYAAAVERGQGEDEAMRGVGKKFDFSDETIRELADIHESAFRKLFSRLSEQAQTRWERVLLIMTIATVAGLAGAAISTSDFFRPASVFMWPATALGGAAVILSLVKAYRLFVRKDHDIRRLRAGLDGVPALGGAGCLTGVFGYFFELFNAGDYGLFLDLKIIYFIYIPVHGGELAGVVDWLLRSSALIIMSMIVALVSGLLWFILVSKADSIEQAEAAYLLENAAGTD